MHTFLKIVRKICISPPNMLFFHFFFLGGGARANRKIYTPVHSTSKKIILFIFLYFSIFSSFIVSSLSLAWGYELGVLGPGGEGDPCVVEDLPTEGRPHAAPSALRLHEVLGKSAVGGTQPLTGGIVWTTRMLNCVHWNKFYFEGPIEGSFHQLVILLWYEKYMGTYLIYIYEYNTWRI